MTRPIRAWWFAPDNGELRYGDGRKPRKNHSHHVSQDAPLALCEYGLHASVRAIDAMSYAPATQVWRVELRGPAVVLGDDKAVAYERRYIAKVPNCDAVLRHFARLCALDVIGKWESDVPDVVMRWLRTGDESLRRAARSAAYSAARDAAYYAAYYAAYSATGDAARDAARDAAYYAARSAAYYAARDAAYYAAYYAAYSAARDSSRDAARSAAYYAAREKQNTRLHRMMLKAIREGR